MIWQSCGGSLTQNRCRGTEIWEQSPSKPSQHRGGCRAGTAGAQKMPRPPSAPSASRISNAAQGSSRRGNTSKQHQGAAKHSHILTGCSEHQTQSFSQTDATKPQPRRFTHVHFQTFQPGGKCKPRVLHREEKHKESPGGCQDTPVTHP